MTGRRPKFGHDSEMTAVLRLLRRKHADVSIGLVLARYPWIAYNDVEEFVTEARSALAARDRGCAEALTYLFARAAVAAKPEDAPVARRLRWWQ